MEETKTEILAKLMGRAIVIIRTCRNMNRKELAEAAKISYPYLCEIEKGDKDASFATIMRICAALRCTPSDLMLFCNMIAEDGELVVPKPIA